MPLFIITFDASLFWHLIEIEKMHFFIFISDFDKCGVYIEILVCFDKVPTFIITFDAALFYTKRLINLTMHKNHQKTPRLYIARHIPRWSNNNMTREECVSLFSYIMTYLPLFYLSKWWIYGQAQRSNT